MTRHDTDLELLERWLAAEAAAEATAADSAEGHFGDADTADEAEAALVALFATLPQPEPSPALAARLSAVADRAAEERHARRAVIFGLPRRTVQRLAAGLLLAVGLGAALVQTLFREVASPALVQLSPGSVLTSAAEALITIFYGLRDWAEAAAELLDGFTRLSGAAATVAGTTPVAVALGAGLVLAIVAFKLLRDLIGKERGFSHVDSD